MSLESSVVDLVQRADKVITIYEQEAERIRSATNNAVKAVPNLMTSVYVHQTLGDDNNDGLTEATPKRTLREAALLGKEFGYLKIFCLSDYKMDSDVGFRFNCTVLLDMKNNKLITSVAKMSDGAVRMYRMNFGDSETANLRVENASELRMPVAADFTALGGTVAMEEASFLYAWQSRNSIEILVLYGVAITGEVGWMLRNRGSRKRLALMLDAVTYPASMAGRWIGSISANTDVNTLSRLQSNLTTL